MADNISPKIKRENVHSRTIVLTQDGNVHDPSKISKAETDESTHAFIQREEGKYEGCLGQTPPHIKIMSQQELIDYEPAADTGHFRFYPKGALMKSLLEDLAEEFALKRLDATRIETSLIYRNQGAVKEQAESFHEHDYRIPNGISF